MPCEPTSVRLQEREKLRWEKTGQWLPGVEEGGAGRKGHTRTVRGAGHVLCLSGGGVYVAACICPGL